MAQMKKGAVLDMAHAHWPSFMRSRTDAILLDKWERGEQYDITDDATDRVKFHGRPYAPKQQEVTDEYEDLGTRTPTPWAGLVVTSLAQTAYVDGVRRSGEKGNMRVWDDWQTNRWDMKQLQVHRTAIGLSTAYGLVLPGKDPLTGATKAKMLARSPKRMAAFYDDDDDEWATFALEGSPQQDELGIHTHWAVRVYDEQVTHFVTCKGDGHDRKDWEYVSYEDHGFKVPPVARCVNRIDLDGRATGEIEPVLPLLRRIDQDMFDRLIVQRFGAWKVRYIAGMAKPSNEQQARLQALKLRVEDLLISGSDKTKFGTLDETPLEGFISVSDQDLRMLSAVSQIPPHHLLGLSANLQSEALAAAEAGLLRKSADFKMNAGEFHEQMFRLVATMNGYGDEARAVDMQVRWRDTESRSLVQAADALGKIAVQLKVPVEMLWEKLPGWTDGDSARAKELIESGDTIEKLLEELLGGDEPGQQGGAGGDGE